MYKNTYISLLTSCKNTIKICFDEYGRCQSTERGKLGFRVGETLTHVICPVDYFITKDGVSYIIYWNNCAHLKNSLSHDNTVCYSSNQQ